MRPRRAGHLAAQPEALDEVVDVGQVIEDPPVAEDDEPAAGHAAEQLQQPAIAGPVDAGRPRDDELDAGARPPPPARAAPLRPWCPGRRRRAGAARPRRPAGARRRRARRRCCSARRAGRRRAAAASTTRPHRRRVDRAVRRVGQAGLPVERGDVVDDLDAARSRRSSDARSARSPRDELDAGRGEIAGPRAGRARARGRRRRGRPAPREVAAGEAGGAGDEDAHRSATTVTGDPSSRSRPARASAPSIRSVRRARADRACAARSAARTAGARAARGSRARASSRAHRAIA